MCNPKLYQIKNITIIPDMVWLCPHPNLMLNCDPKCWIWGLVGCDWIMGADFLLAVLMIVSSHKIWLLKNT